MKTDMNQIELANGILISNPEERVRDYYITTRGGLTTKGHGHNISAKNAELSGLSLSELKCEIPV